MIDRLVNTGIGIQVRTEFDTDGFAPRNDAQLPVLARKVLCSVESHVLQEVSQSSLARFFENRTDTLCDIEVSQMGFLSVVANVVGHAVFQRPFSYGWVLRQLCEAHHCHHHQ